jgi:hypothetical protein
MTPSLASAPESCLSSGGSSAVSGVYGVFTWPWPGLQLKFVGQFVIGRV